jgi:hypothetical protein
MLACEAIAEIIFSSIEPVVEVDKMWKQKRQSNKKQI